LDDFASTLTTAIRASGLLPGSITLSHGAVVAVLFAADLNTPILIAAASLALWSLYSSLRDLAGTPVHGSVSEMHLASDGTVVLRRRGDGPPEHGRLVGAWASGFLVVLRVRLPRSTGWPRAARAVTIARGTLSDDAFRRLRVILRARRWAE
jgi:hypothetical protein